MPRASWNGFLRLSLVSCPVYLSPATSEAKRIRLNQLNAETGNRVAQQLFVRGQATLSTAIRLYCAGKNGTSVCSGSPSPLRRRISTRRPGKIRNPSHHRSTIFELWQ